jgi:hypothetical protein
MITTPEIEKIEDAIGQKRLSIAADMETVSRLRAAERDRMKAERRRLNSQSGKTCQQTDAKWMQAEIKRLRWVIAGLLPDKTAEELGDVLRLSRGTAQILRSRAKRYGWEIERGKP